jgi:hypothetical protein
MTYITSPSYTEQLLTAYDVSDVAGDARSILGNFTDVMLGGSTPAMSPPPITCFCPHIISRITKRTITRCLIPRSIDNDP